MGIGRTRAVALVGVTAALVEVEAELSSQVPGVQLIGMADRALKEAQERVRAAVTSSGLEMPRRRLTVSLSPAAVPKHGSAFDLAIAVATLATEGVVAADAVADAVHLGELGLDGRLRPVPGILPAVLGAKRAGVRTVVVPTGNGDEAELVPGVRVVALPSLSAVAEFWGAEIPVVPVEPVEAPEAAPAAAPDLELADVIGNDEAVEALVVAAAGGHHLLMVGPPGAGKTMLAQRLPGILPPLDPDAAIEAACVRSVGAVAGIHALVTTPPFEAPHHTASTASLVGGGSGRLVPGAASRAAHGVLFLDEAPEFAGRALDALRQPLESGVVQIQRAHAQTVFPARFQLVLAANPCPCGMADDPAGECTCPSAVRRGYLDRISGPIRDRVDIHVRMRRVTPTQLRMAPGRPRPTTAETRLVVERARARAAARLAGTPWRLNAEIDGRALREGPFALAPAAVAPLHRAYERGGLSMRGVDKVLRLARTLADLDDVDAPGVDHVERAHLLRKGV